MQRWRTLFKSNLGYYFSFKQNYIKTFKDYKRTFGDHDNQVLNTDITKYHNIIECRVSILQ